LLKAKWYAHFYKKWCLPEDCKNLTNCYQKIIGFEWQLSFFTSLHPPFGVYWILHKIWKGIACLLMNSSSQWHPIIPSERWATVSMRGLFSCFLRSKKLWLDGFLKLNSILTVKELSDLQDVMRDKELNLRTDIYEILLQDEFVSW
jgi:hypothetical protein